MKIKGAIFDMDGTLVNSLIFWDVFWTKLGNKYLGIQNFKPDEELDTKVRTMIFNEAIACARESLGMQVGLDELITFSNSRIEDFYRYEVEVKAGVFDFLNYLKDSGVKIALASASEMKYVNVALEACGLSDYFDPSLVFSCADIGADKSKPDIYLKTQKALGFEADEICVIEDSLVALQTAKAEGFKTVGIYDANNFSQDKLKATSDIYVSKDETMADLINKINA
jgi:HAD superfamily hydrolase (TIGR01509 family)